MTVRMKAISFLLFGVALLFGSSRAMAQGWVITPQRAAPEAVSNNAVCEGFIADTAYVYTFGGIDSTKRYNGIHLRSYRYNTLNDTWQQIPPLPDTRGKIACAASRIGTRIYIVGGYYVSADGSEESSNKVHRYDIATNTFLPDGAPLPIPIDDHVQVVWRDSLLYVVTGWSNTATIPNVQIYNPRLDTWTAGTPVPTTHAYKSFGASGAIIGDTIYYFGGAASQSGFPIQPVLRRGIINPDNPAQIWWSDTTIAAHINGYRMAATTVGHAVHWLGGSAVTYNYDGIAYNGSGGVPPANRVFSLHNNNWGNWRLDSVQHLPMDLRGIATTNDTVRYLVGGMHENQMVSNTTYRLVWSNSTVGIPESAAQTQHSIHLSWTTANNIAIFCTNPSLHGKAVLNIANVQGKTVVQQRVLIAEHTTIPLPRLSAGVYILHLQWAAHAFAQKFAVE